MIIIKDLVKVYENNKKNVVALKNINLEFPKHGLVSLIGRNGCGKSTLLGLLAGLIEPTNGEIFFEDNTNSSQNGFSKKSVNDVALVLQESHFVDYLSMENNMLISLDKSTIINNGMFLNEMNINDLLYRKPRTLSGGQKQKFSIFRSLLRDYTVLLVDEPTSSLDEQTEKMIFDYLKDVSKEKLVIVVSHNLELVYKYSDTIIELVEGEVSSVKHISNKGDQSNVHYLSREKSYQDYSWSDIKEEVHEKGKVFLIDENLVFRDSPKSKSFLVNPANSNQKIDIHRNKTIVIKSILNSLLKILSYGILTSIFVILFSILSSMMFLNEIAIQYKSFKHSEMVYVNYKNNYYTEIDSEYKILSYNDLEKVSQKIDLLVEFQSEVYFESQGDQFYNPLISGIVFTENRNNFYGVFPKEGEIMITDYHADMLIKEKIFISKDEILNKTVKINNKELTVSAILDTDYESFIPIFDYLNFSNTNKFLKWNDKFINVYSKIYYNKDTYINNLTEFKNYPIEYGNVFVDMYLKDLSQLNVLFQFDNINGISCYMSEKLYTLLGNPEIIKIYGTVLQIKGVVSGDSNEIYFMNEEEFSSAISPIFSIESINLYEYTLDDIQFLAEVGMIHDTPISYNLISLFRVINSLNKLFLFFSIALILLIGLLSFLCSSSIIVSDSKLINLAIYFNHPGKNICQFEMYKIYIYILFLVTFSTIVSLLITDGINSYILANVETKIVLFSPSYWILGLIIIFSIICMLCGFLFGFFGVKKKMRKGSVSF